MMSPGRRSVLAPKSPFLRRSLSRTFKSNFFSVHMAHDFCPVARGIGRQSARSDHGIQHGHVRLEGNGFRGDRLTNNADLLAVSAHKVADDDSDDGVGHKLLQPRLQCRGQAAGVFSRPRSRHQPAGLKCVRPDARGRWWTIPDCATPKPAACRPAQSDKLLVQPGWPIRAGGRASGRSAS